MVHPKYAFSAVCFCAQLALAQLPGSASTRGQAQAVSETDFLQDVPTVISVSRLSQPLEDTPGAVTLLDRNFIRMSGARDVVDLLRFVPGFQTTTAYETDAPMATYHGRNDDWANRIQVLVDGRSVYSGLLQGSAGIGWKTLALDDIERIEVLRGSNSATYGARAFLGVVNIISRDVRETTGAAATLTHGENNVRDVGMRVGWSQEGGAAFRISADSTSDDGLRGAFGKNRTERLNIASFIPLASGSELELRAGGVGMYAGRGDPKDTEGNPARMWFVGSQYLQADWRRVLSDASDLAISASHTENAMRDRFVIQSHLVYNGVDYFQAPVDFGGVEQVNALSLQYGLRLSPALRTVWGAEYRREAQDAPTLFAQGKTQVNDYFRLFGSMEWRFADRWVLNAGALAERNDFSGDSFSPRLMLNWHVAPGHTLRAGASTAFRPPSAYEKYGQRNYLDANGQNPIGFFTYNDGSLLPERLFSRELGYNFALPKLPISGDVRVFNEQIIDGISKTDTTIIPGVQPEYNLNDHQDEINGLEWQLAWNPSSATRLLWTQSWTTISARTSISAQSKFRTEHSAARYAAGLTLMHRLDSGLQLSLMHQVSDDMALMSISDRPWLFSMQRTDVRIGQDFRIGNTKAELGLVIQNLNNPFEDGDHKFFFTRRAMLSLRVEL